MLYSGEKSKINKKFKSCSKQINEFNISIISSSVMMNFYINSFSVLVVVVKCWWLNKITTFDWLSKINLKITGNIFLRIVVERKTFLD